MSNEEERPNYKITEATLDDLVFAKENPVKHNKKNRQLIENSLNEFGAVRSIGIAEDNEILAGNGTVREAKDGGIVKKVLIIDTEPDTLVAVRRSDLSEEQKIRYAITDNAAAKSAIFDDEVLTGFKKKGIDLTGLGVDKVGQKKAEVAEAIADYPESEKKYYVIVELDTQEQQEFVYGMMQEEGHVVFKYSGDRQRQNRGD